MKKLLIGLGAGVGIIIIALLILSLEIGLLLGLSYVALIGIDLIASWFGTELVPDEQFTTIMLVVTLVLFVVNRIRVRAIS